MNIVIIDDDVLVSSALKTILESKEEIRVSGMGQDGGEALRLYREHKPDVLLMDIRMKNVSGLAASREILKEYPEAKILLLTTFSDDEYIVKALKYGVKGYLLKQDYNSILEAHEISGKELEVISLVAEGLSNKEIAKRLFLSEGTVRNYISSILDKLELRDRTQLAVYYLNTTR